MRRAFKPLLGAVAIFAVSAGIAQGITPPRCGTLYTPACTSPHLSGVISAACKPAGSVLHPSVTATSNAGIRKVTVSFRGHTLASRHFNGQGPTSSRVRFAVNTTGLAPGGYPVKVLVTDI